VKIRKERKMAVKAVLGLVIIFASSILYITECCGEDKLGRDDFLSTSIASVFDKVGQYTSGEKKIVDRDEGRTVQSTGTNVDGLGRTVKEPNITIRGNIPSDKGSQDQKVSP
jgi:hypothetical protein